MKLDFRTWFEKSDDEHAQNLINQQVQSNHNDEAVDDYVKKSTLKSDCIEMVNNELRGVGFSKQVHSAPISGNLLIIENKRLGRASTIVDTNMELGIFRFYDTGVEIGNIRLWFPPLIFTAADSILFKSIVLHELQHADDYVSGHYQPQKGHYGFNKELYLKRQTERRALFTQLQYLLKRIGNVEEIIKMLSGEDTGAKNQSPFAMHTELIPVAEAFLRHFSGMKEDWRSWAKGLTVPLVGAGMIGQPTDFPQNYANQEPTSIVYNMQAENARTAAQKTMLLMQTFVFRQYISAPSKKS